MSNAAPKKLPAVGTRVRAVDGPHFHSEDDNAGTVIEHVSSRWGVSAKVQMDDGSIQTCEGLREIGIGWRQLHGGAPVVTVEGVH